MASQLCSHWLPLFSSPPSPSSFIPSTLPLIHRPRSQWTTQKSSVPVSCRSGGGDTDAADRVLAASAYLLPFLDGVQYGRYLFMQFPVAKVALQPLYPLLQIYSSTPFASVAVFFGFYFLVVRNPNLSRYVRFNTMQAIVLDVLLILPSLVESMYHPNGGLGLEALVIFYNTVFLYLLACFLVGSGSCLLGRIPRLPLVADAADAQVLIGAISTVWGFN